MNKNRTIAITGALSALIILMGIPGLHLGLIPINPSVSLTIMHIPVALAAVLCGFPGGIVTGLVFGLTSLVNASANPSGILDPLFTNPLISVLPRILYGVCAAFLFKIINFIPKFPKTVNAAITAFISSIIHSFIVIGSLYLFLYSKTLEAMNGASYLIVMGSILPGASLEALASAIICAAVCGTLFISGKKKAKLLSEE